MLVHRGNRIEKPPITHAIHRITPPNTTTQNVCLLGDVILFCVEWNELDLTTIKINNETMLMGILSLPFRAKISVLFWVKVI